MKSFSSVWLVATREIRERGRSKPYLITSAVTILMVLAIIIVPGFFGDSTQQYNIGSVGQGNTEIIETAMVLGNINDEPDAEASVEMTIVPYDSRADAEAGLDQGDIVAALVDAEEIVVQREGGFLSDSGPIGLLQRAAGAIALEKIAAENGQAAADVIEILSSDPLEVTPLVASTDESNANSIIAYFGLILLYMAIILYGTWILTGVTEEKTNRVVEVMISAIKPWQLLAGKIVGIGVLAIAQFVGTITLAYAAIRIFNTFEIPTIQITGLLNLALWFLLGFALYSVLFGAAGSLVGRIEDAQSAAMPMTLFSVVGFFAGFAVLDNPDGTVAVVTSLIPFTAPFTVPIRVSLDAIPWWEFVLSVTIMIVTIYFAVRLAGRIYAGGILRSGQKTKLRDAWRSAQT
jgi:ABC-2 type transport system permease protein